MQNKKILPILLIVGGAVAAYSSSSKKDGNGNNTILPPINPNTPLPDAGGQQQTEGNNSDVGFVNEFTEIQEIKEFSREMYINLKKSDWKQLLKMYLDAGYNLETAYNQLFQIWNNPANPLRLKFNSPKAFFLSIIVNSSKKGIGNTIEWDSTPIYPTMDNYWNGVDAWTCAQWKVYHQKLEEHYNNTYAANQIWEIAWNHPDNYALGTTLVAGGTVAGVLAGGWGAVIGGALGAFVASYVDCRYQCDFIEYLYSKDIEIGDLISNTSCSLSNIVKNIVGTVEGITDTLKAVSPLIPFALAFVGYQIFKNK